MQSLPDMNRHHLAARARRQRQNGGYALFEILFILGVISAISVAFARVLPQTLRRSRTDELASVLRAVERAATLAHVEQARRPESSLSLVESGLLSERAALDPWGHPFRIDRTKEDRAVATSAGPDGRYRTDDDLRSDRPVTVDPGDFPGEVRARNLALALGAVPWVITFSLLGLGRLLDRITLPRRRRKLEATLWPAWEVLARTTGGELISDPGPRRRDQCLKTIALTTRAGQVLIRACHRTKDAASRWELDTEVEVPFTTKETDDGRRVVWSKMKITGLQLDPELLKSAVSLATDVACQDPSPYR